MYGEHGSPSGQNPAYMSLHVSHLKFPRSLIMRSYKTFMWNLHLNIRWPMVETFFRPKSTSGLDHDFKYIVSQDKTRWFTYWKWDFWHLISRQTMIFEGSYFFHLFSNISMFFKWFSIYSRSPRCRLDVSLYDGTQVEQLFCWGRPVCARAIADPTKFQSQEVYEKNWIQEVLVVKHMISQRTLLLTEQWIYWITLSFYG